MIASIHGVCLRIPRMLVAGSRGRLGADSTRWRAVWRLTDGGLGSGVLGVVKGSRGFCFPLAFAGEVEAVGVVNEAIEDCAAGESPWPAIPTQVGFGADRFRRANMAPGRPLLSEVVARAGMREQRR